MEASTQLRELAKMGEALVHRVTHSADELFDTPHGTGAVTDTDLLKAPGLFIMNIRKGGLLVAGACVGNGLMLKKLDPATDGDTVFRWSAPLPVKAYGIHAGLCLGYVHVNTLMLINSLENVDSFLQRKWVYGYETGVAVGVHGAGFGSAASGSGAGDAALAGVAGINRRMRILQMYSICTQGILVDATVKGAVIMPDCQIIEQVYGAGLLANPSLILQGQVPPPPATWPLYDELTRHRSRWDEMYLAWKKRWDADAPARAPQAAEEQAVGATAGRSTSMSPSSDVSSTWEQEF